MEKRIVDLEAEIDFHEQIDIKQNEIESQKTSVIELKNNQHPDGLLESTYDYLCSLYIFSYFVTFCKLFIWLF